MSWLWPLSSTINHYGAELCHYANAISRKRRTVLLVTYVTAGNTLSALKFLWMFIPLRVKTGTNQTIGYFKESTLVVSLYWVK